MACRVSAWIALLGLFRFDMFGRTAHAYTLIVLFVLFPLGAAARQFALRFVATGDQG